MTEATLRVLTWNVHSCIGTDGRLDPDRVREHVRAIDPDIAALQEVDSRRDRRDGFDLLGNCLGKDLSNHRAVVRTIRTADGDYGHMLLSRWPISTWREHDITFGSREPRSMIEATIESDLGRINVLCLHLGLGRRERQIDAFAMHVRHGMEALDFEQRQRLVRLLVDQVRATGPHVEIHLRIPLDEPPSPDNTDGRPATGDAAERAVSSKDRLRSLGGDLFLDRATQGPHSQRLHRAERGARATPRVSEPIRSHRSSLSMDFHAR